ncbi:AraC family transcriptional regulator ligand-binding domain-containing protein [Devosia sp.]|uniref:AraC family transcriptional regulator n=1 Tax=Devosia sp. TaxID=1871048 RepID=UPI003A8DE424
MRTVTPTFARALARAAGFELTDDGRLLQGDEIVRRLTLSDGKLLHREYFDLVDWVDSTHPDRTGLPFAYARAVDIDNLGALGLAMKTAPTLRDSLQRAERYFRLLTDTVAYRLDDRQEPSVFTLHHQSEPHPALELRNECAMCGFGHVFKTVVGPELSYEYVSFRHSGTGEVARYETFFGCPVRFGADRNAIAFAEKMLELPTRLGDPAVSRFLTEHLEAEIGTLSPEEAAFERSLAEHFSKALSNGIPSAANVARTVGMSERTLYRRLAEAGLTYQGVLEKTQKSLAENLLSDEAFSIAEVAFLTGFSEQSSFTRAFRRWAGVSPGAYRKRSAPS